MIREFVDDWITAIVDCTERVRKIRGLLNRGHADQARRLLPREAVYPVPPALQRRLGITP